MINRMLLSAAVCAAILALASACHTPVSADDAAWMDTSTDSSSGGGGTVSTGWSPLGAVWNGGFASPMYGSWSIWGGGDSYAFKGDSTYASPADNSASLLFGFAGNTSAGWGGGSYYVGGTDSTSSSYYYSLAGSGFNAYVFYIKGLAPYGGTNGTLTIGFGNGSNPTMYAKGFNASSAWQKIVIPIPNDLDNLRVASPLYMAEGEASTVWGYNYWLSNIGFVKDTVDTISLTSWTLGSSGSAISTGLQTWNSGSSTASNSVSTIAVGQTLPITDRNDASFKYAITINDSSVAGGTQSATISGRPAHQISWASSDTGIATVDSSGNVKGISAGTVTLTPTINGIQAITGGATGNTGSPETLTIQVIQY